MSELSLYDILGVPQIAERDEIITAYRRMAKLYHPDYAGDEGREMFEDVQRAYKCLSDEKQRRKYDAIRKILGEVGERLFEQSNGGFSSSASASFFYGHYMNGSISPSSIINLRRP